MTSTAPPSSARGERCVPYAHDAITCVADAAKIRSRIENLDIADQHANTREANTNVKEMGKKGWGKNRIQIKKHYTVVKEANKQRNTRMEDHLPGK